MKIIIVIIINILLLFITINLQEILETFAPFLYKFLVCSFLRIRPLLLKIPSCLPEYLINKYYIAVSAQILERL